MKKKAGIIAASVASIVMCSSVIAGSTFALFTSESSVDVVVKSAKVNVTATPTSIVTGYDEEHLTSANTEFTATFDDSAKLLTLDKMAPGDYVTFDIDIANNSSIDVLYRVGYECENGYLLMNGLNITFGKKDTAAVPLNGYKSYKTSWETVPYAEDSKNVTYSVKVELPWDAGNAYNGGLNAALNFKVEAVQGNADKKKVAEVEELPAKELLTKYASEEKITYINSESSAADLTNALGNGGAVVFDGDVNYSGKLEVAADTVLLLEGHDLDMNGNYILSRSGDISLVNGNVKAQSLYSYGATHMEVSDCDVQLDTYLYAKDTATLEVNNSNVTTNRVQALGNSTVTLNNSEVSVAAVMRAAGSTADEIPTLNINDSKVTSQCKVSAGAFTTAGTFSGNINISGSELNISGVDNAIETNGISEVEVRDSSVTVSKYAFITFDSSKLSLYNTEVNAYAYAVSTNAAIENWTESELVHIEGCTFNTESSAVLFNVNAMLTITGTTINAGAQAVIVRGGEAVISDSHLTLNGLYSEETANKYIDGWETGSKVPFAALVVGNNKGNSYQYATRLTVTNTSVSATEGYFKVYVHGNATEDIGVTFNYDGAEEDITVGGGYVKLNDKEVSK